MYKIDRRTLVKYAFSIPAVVSRIIERMQEDIVLGSEFIITDNDLLTTFEVLPAILVHPLMDNPYMQTVSVDECDVVYNAIYDKPTEEVVKYFDNLTTKLEKQKQLVLELKESVMYELCLYTVVRQPDRPTMYFLLDKKTELTVANGSRVKLNNWLSRRKILPSLVYNYNLIKINNDQFQTTIASK